ncbi:MAG: transposase [Vulcanimicrobiota bacterium]
MGIVYNLRPKINFGTVNRTISSRKPWTEVRDHIEQQNLQGLAVELAREVLVEAMEQEANELCGGAKGKHFKNERQASRHGTKRCCVPYGAARMEIERPRVRDENGELKLSTYLAAKKGELSPDDVLATCADGASQRRFPRVAQTLQGTRKTGIYSRSKSAVNRYFIQAAERVVKTIQTRPLNGTRYLALYLDGTVEKGYHAIAALGLSSDGEKKVLGLREGSSENAEVCKELLADLLRRGLDVGEKFIAVIDGGKGLASALRTVFGDRVLIQRCRAHKLRNVTEKLPERDREGVKQRLNRAWTDLDAKAAKRKLELIATQLKSKGWKDAANSLREGLAETLTCNSLGLPSDCDLTRFLVTTNPLESLFARHTEVSRWVCRWRNGQMLTRWTGTSLAIAELSFTRVGNKEKLRRLEAALSRPSEQLAAA